MSGIVDKKKKNQKGSASSGGVGSGGKKQQQPPLSPPPPPPQNKKPTLPFQNKKHKEKEDAKKLKLEQEAEQKKREEEEKIKRETQKVEIHFIHFDTTKEEWQHQFYDTAKTDILEVTVPSSLHPSLASPFSLSPPAQGFEPATYGVVPKNGNKNKKKAVASKRVVNKSIRDALISKDKVNGIRFKWLPQFVSQHVAHGYDMEEYEFVFVEDNFDHIVYEKGGHFDSFHRDSPKTWPLVALFYPKFPDYPSYKGGDLVVKLPSSCTPPPLPKQDNGEGGGGGVASEEEEEKKERIITITPSQEHGTLVMFPAEKLFHKALPVLGNSGAAKHVFKTSCGFKQKKRFLDDRFENFWSGWGGGDEEEDDIGVGVGGWRRRPRRLPSFSGSEDLAD